MSMKTILTVLTNETQTDTCLDHAINLTRAEDAHLDVLALGVDPTQVGYYYSGANALIHQFSLEQATETANAVTAAAQKRLEGADLRFGLETAATQLASMSPLVAERARFSDLVVLEKPYGKDCGAEMEALVEIALFEGQAPVLIIPPSVKAPAFPKKIVIGWNESRESLVAVRRALPFLKQADQVYVTIVDPPRHGANRSDPGGLLSQYLVRHGVSVEVCVIAKTLPRVSDQLQRHAQDIGAEMLVMGAYGHSRFREAILGGATRNTLEASDIPVFMAH
ncbi:universal stress protein [Pseudaestuariivita rosea]|uniref:universal stress protein n=1 Tax=Pseudaestuariivita rosea TaxID=2763263 RepID=UPI001ABB9E22|nr:universal stress protein [Pseudaestuariivita rosea]